MLRATRGFKQPRRVEAGGCAGAHRGSNVVKSSTLSALAADPALVSASEANRSFSALLRQVAQGQSFTVHSHGRPVANLMPVSESGPRNAVARRGLLARLAAQPASGEARSWQRDDLYD